MHKTHGTQDGVGGSRAVTMTVCCTPVRTPANGASLVLTMPLGTSVYDTLTVSGGRWRETALVFNSCREFRPFSGVWLRGVYRVHRRAPQSNLLVPSARTRAVVVPITTMVRNVMLNRFSMRKTHGTQDGVGGSRAVPLPVCCTPFVHS